jgi:P4 family phage/plasmid primase-like protien
MNHTQYKDLVEFLAKHNAKNDAGTSPTHTRIGNKELNVYGGSYIIPTEELDNFYSLYYTHVFERKRSEHLTEKQQDNTGPILIDFDFRYSHEIEKRQHTKEHIQDILNLIYLETIKEFFLFEERKNFPIYVFEKPDVNRLTDGSLTKDGIHVIIGIQMDHIMQQMLRERVLLKIGEICDLPLINTWDSVLDEGITKGTTNWQVFGSNKPGYGKYELTQHYEITFDAADGEFMMEEKRVEDFDIKTNIFKLSAQYPNHPKFEINPSIVTEYNTRCSTTNNKRIRKASSNTKLKLLTATSDDNSDNENVILLEDITCIETLKKAVDNVMNSLNANEYTIRELHEYTQILPEKYYEPGSHSLNRQVAFALKHTDDRLFLSWVMLRSKASDFDYSTIPTLRYQWTHYFKDKPNGVTKRSIMYWAKQDVYDDYIKIKKNTVEYFITESITTPTDYDFAMVLYQMFKDKYVCVSITNKIWYVFRNHRWERDLGNSLRLAISRDMYDLYQDRVLTIREEMLQYESSEDGYINAQKRIKEISEIVVKFKRTNDKTNIFKEAAEVFYDEDFSKKMDENKYLLCFTNGVVDFKNKIFRDGYPQDYITKSTRIPYIDKFTDANKECITQITNFMEQLFPEKTLNNYMWEHLASTLIGENMNQTFNIYRGSGSNGKSILTDFMATTLGDYSGTVPITLVTEKRVGLGATSSEVMQLKGIRYAVMQEPSKNAQINEGMMKQLTGGDPLQARALYQESETFIPQFSLVVCTNTLPEIMSNDDGTWRRIRIVEYMSKFVDSLQVEKTEENRYHFLKDKALKDKLPTWAPIFASMLVQKAFNTQGVVNDCDIVLAASNKYRQGQDHISGFVNDMVRSSVGSKITKRELCEEFKLWFQEQQGSKRMPKGVELCEYMDNRFGKAKRDGWHNVEINTNILDAVDEL